MHTSSNPELITFTHSPVRGTQTSGISKAAQQLLEDAGWRRRAGSLMLPAAPSGRPRFHQLQASIARLEAAGFQVLLFDDEPSAAEHELTDRARDLLVAVETRRAAALSPAAVQDRLDALEAKSDPSARQAIELRALQARRQEQIEAGARSDFSPAVVHSGDTVTFDGGSGVVRRVCRRWVSVELVDGCRARVPYVRISGVSSE